MSDKISVVIPTYNRLPQLAEVLEHLLASDTTGFDDVDIIVVDDGSPESPESLVAELNISSPFRISLVRQENAGPAAARNNGFRSSSNEIVLFIDDDVLAPSGLLRGHVKAHRENPSSIVFGLYPYVKPETETASYRYLEMLERDARREIEATGPGPYMKTNIVASGNLSVETSTFAARGAVYDDTLITPMAEEIELATRLAEEGTPIIYAPELNALHTQPTTIEGKCIQDYKYGLGIAESYSRLHGRVPDEQFSYTLKVNGPIQAEDPASLKAAKVIKSSLAAKRGRSAIVFICRLVEKIFPNNDRVLFWLFRKAIGIHYFAGIREGLRRFGESL